MARASLIIGRDLPEVVVPRGRVLAELARSPHDLTLHAERLARTTAPPATGADDPGADVYAALLDLFIATDPDQAEVRRWALDEYGTSLGPAEHDALAAAVDTGLHPASPVPPSAASLFTQGVTQPAPLVAGQTPTAEPPTPREGVGEAQAEAPAQAPAQAPDGSATSAEDDSAEYWSADAHSTEHHPTEDRPTEDRPAEDRPTEPWVRRVAVGAVLAAVVVAWGRRHRTSFGRSTNQN